MRPADSRAEIFPLPLGERSLRHADQAGVGFFPLAIAPQETIRRVACEYDRGLVGIAHIVQPIDERLKLLAVFAGVESHRLLFAAAVADPIRGTLVPGHAPQPEVRIADGLLLAPIATVLREPSQ